MKTLKQTLTICLILLFNMSIMANNLIIKEKNGQVSKVQIDKSQVRNKGIQSGAEAMFFFENIEEMKTADFELFEKLMTKTEKRYTHINLEFTGDDNVYALRLEKLRKRRAGADVARAAGGVMMILGVLSGDRGLTAAGLATNGAGRIARDINDDRTSNTQTQMLNDLDRRTKLAEQKSEEAELKRLYGEENVEGLKALLDGKHKRALALANVGETAELEDHRISAIYLKAMIAADQQDKKAEDNQLNRIVEADSEIKDIAEARLTIEELMREVERLRA